MSTSKSILQSTKECYLCRLWSGYSNTEVDLHHVMNGGGHRKVCNDNGGTIYLCRFHHTYVHQHAPTRKMLKKLYQVNFEKEHSHDEWMKLYGKNYKEEQ